MLGGTADHVSIQRKSLLKAGFFFTIPATTYSPTQLPMQYHRR